MWCIFSFMQTDSESSCSPDHENCSSSKLRYSMERHETHTLVCLFNRAQQLRPTLCTIIRKYCCTSIAKYANLCFLLYEYYIILYNISNCYLVSQTGPIINCNKINSSFIIFIVIFVLKIWFNNEIQARQRKNIEK